MIRTPCLLPNWLRSAACVLLVLSIAACAGPAPDLDASTSGGKPRIDDALKTMLVGVEAPPIEIDAPTMAMLREYYRAHHYAPLWVAEDGLAPRGAALFTALAKARDAGAPVVAPLLSAAIARRQSTQPPSLAELELLLSAALLRTAIDPAEPTSAAPLPHLLPTAAGTRDITGFLRRRLPPDPGFWRLHAAAAGYREIVAGGGWPRVPPGPKLERGARDARVTSLRARLAAGGDLPEQALGDADLFDEALEAAVKRFQARHGLESDGVVGDDTLAALNRPAASRLATVIANLRRQARAPRDWGSSYLVVNIAAATYRLVESGRTVMEHAAIVGRPDWQTPEIDSAIERIELNPYWTVPPRIARLELGPKAASDPGYLERQGIRRVNGLYRQEPGPANVLGRAKFLFDNGYDVYLHDTNSPGLFERSERHLSHGCVRVPNAIELVAHLLRDDPDWTREKIDDVLARGKNRGTVLRRPLPIHLVYDTAWVDEAGRVEFRADIYGRDGRTEIASAE